MNKTPDENRRSMLYITRQKSANGGGWLVRIGQNKPNGETRVFCDNKLGGIHLALNAAQDYRDDLLVKLGINEKVQGGAIFRRPHRISLRKENGIIGVIPQTIKSGDKNYKVWRASYTENGQRKIKTFSVIKFGDCGAFREACKLRYEKAGELVQVGDPDLPCDPLLPLIK